MKLNERAQNGIAHAIKTTGTLMFVKELATVYSGDGKVGLMKPWVYAIPPDIRGFIMTHCIRLSLPEHFAMAERSAARAEQYKRLVVRAMEKGRWLAAEKLVHKARQHHEAVEELRTMGRVMYRIRPNVTVEMLATLQVKPVKPLAKAS